MGMVSNDVSFMISPPANTSAKRPQTGRNHGGNSQGAIAVARLIMHYNALMGKGEGWITVNDFIIQFRLLFKYWTVKICDFYKFFYFEKAKVGKKNTVIGLLTTFVLFVNCVKISWLCNLVRGVLTDFQEKIYYLIVELSCRCTI